MSKASAYVRQIPINDTEFELLRALFYQHTGVQLPPVKRPLVCGRLAKRLAALELDSYHQYYKYITSYEGTHELQRAIDLITTHETYFFREPQHFDFLERHIIPHLPPLQGLRVWSAASSTGEEAYTLAMVLDAKMLGRSWSILGTDISQAVLHSARKGLFVMERGTKIPAHYLKTYCLKGRGDYEGYFLVDKNLRQKVEFQACNLVQGCPEIGQFDLILLRNVLIYFDLDTKQKVLKNVLERLKPGGWLMLGHSESLQDAPQRLESLAPSVYRKSV